MTKSPTRARRRFDISSLASLEADDPQMIDPADDAEEELPLMSQPLFWVAVAGWAVAILFLVVVIVIASC